MPGGPSQVRMCADALIGLAKAEGHDGAPDRPRHQGRRPGRAPDAGARGRRGAELRGRSSVGAPDPGGRQEPVRGRGRGRVVRDGAPTGCTRPIPGHLVAGRSSRGPRPRSLAGPAGRWPSRCRHWRSPRGRPGARQPGWTRGGSQLVAAVLDRVAGLRPVPGRAVRRAAGGVRVEDPGCDLAVAAALASAALAIPPPSSSAFVGEIALTGRSGGAGPRAAARRPARAAGIRTVFAAGESACPDGVRLVQVGQCHRRPRGMGRASDGHDEVVARARPGSGGPDRPRRLAKRQETASDQRISFAERRAVVLSLGCRRRSSFRLGGGSRVPKGDTVVHPEHGAAVIEELREREILGRSGSTSCFDVAYGDLTLHGSRGQHGGGRAPPGRRPRARSRRSSTCFGEDESKMAANWSRRFKNNIEKLQLGRHLPGGRGGPEPLDPRARTRACPPARSA